MILFSISAAPGGAENTIAAAAAEGVSHEICLYRMWICV